MRRQHRPFILIVTMICIVISHAGISPTAATPDRKLYLPVITNTLASPFGVQISQPWIYRQSVFVRANELGAKWLRLDLISWRDVQPTRGGDYNWGALLNFESELIGARIAGLIPIVVIQGSPDWATKTYYDAANKPYQTACGAIRADRFEDFAKFMQALVARYKRPPYNVRYWELGNEVDIDPSLVDKDNLFGCWGDINDPYYGGEHYGKMLKVVTPAIKKVDPDANVLIGGLALDNPATTQAGKGQPEKFMEGILRAGAGKSFDIAAYHAYASFANRSVDTDLVTNAWSGHGGLTVGKARFLRAVMARYGVEKPLFLNETGLLYRGDTASPDYLQAQADHLVRIFTRAIADDIQAIFWYTLNGPGWFSAGLLDTDQKPRLSYYTYQHFIKRTSGSHAAKATTDYGSAVEAYRFNKGHVFVDVLWSRDATAQSVVLPQTRFVAAYTRDGSGISPAIADSRTVLNVGASPIYIERHP